MNPQQETGYDKAGRLSAEDQQMMGSPNIMPSKEPKMMDFEEAPLSSTPTKVAPFMPERLKAIQMPKPFHI